ncbi:sulfatase [Ruania alkalisoli]|uniref:Sulfatase n=1 Tax=Ruania alkalisoli TaxID=2779775 RepID=A0A7M1SU53_9MICO|nr:sulfatase [Ruania alkalisoli]QOR71106.1 sulfatase [Ruania alkalisoli]
MSADHPDLDPTRRPEPAPVTTPNVLLLHCHDLGRYLGSYGIDTVQTPHLDALAADGVRFDQAFCTAPQCSPSRASLFTGRYPHAAGVNGLTHAQFAWDLNDDERHLALELQEAGYATSLLGVQHESRGNGSTEAMAARLGFDRLVLDREIGHPCKAEDVATHARDEITRFAAGDRPFYLQVGFVEPHRLPGFSRSEPGYMGFISDYMEPDDERGVTIPPYIADEGESTRDELAELQGAIRYLDAQVGCVFAALEETGQAENTLVIFTTDHGVALPRAKCALYDPGLEVAWVMRCPALGWTGGMRVDEMVSNIDLFPTVLEVAGVRPRNEIHGRSLRPLLDRTDAASGADAAGPGGRGTLAVERHPGRSHIFGEMTYHDYYDPRRCVRSRSHKLIANFTAAPEFMDSSQSWRPRTMPTTPVRAYHPPIELYDLRTDPHETQNVADEAGYAEIRAELLRELYTWMRETGDPLLGGAVTSPLHELSVSLLAAAGEPVASSG